MGKQCLLLSKIKGIMTGLRMDPFFIFCFNSNFPNTISCQNIEQKMQKHTNDFRLYFTFRLIILISDLFDFWLSSSSFDFMIILLWTICTDQFCPRFIINIKSCYSSLNELSNYTKISFLVCVLIFQRSTWKMCYLCSFKDISVSFLANWGKTIKMFNPFLVLLFESGSAEGVNLCKGNLTS